jgi:muconolactone delta-isomerase
MPLRVWRTDDVLPLLPHPNDPAQPPAPASPPPGTATRPAEFLSSFTLPAPPGESARATGDLQARRALELAGPRRVLRLWTLSGQARTLCLWESGGTSEMPGDAGTGVQTTRLSPHPSDPALTDR